MLPTALSIKPHRFLGGRIKEEKEEGFFHQCETKASHKYVCYIVNYQCYVIKYEDEIRAH